MSVLDRSALSDSPLADLHEIASELSIDSYRRLRRDDLIQAILDKQGVVEEPEPSPESSPEPDAGPEAAQTTDEEQEPTGTRRRRGRRGGRGRARADEDTGDETTASGDQEEAAQDDEEETPKPRPGRRGRPERPVVEAEPEAEPAREADEPVVDGVVELLPNGSGFLRVQGSKPSDDDVYISAAQVKRCELVSGDRVSGPKRPPRRSERFASLIRVEQINGRPASELADSVRFDDLPSALPTERIVVGSQDPTLEAIEWLTPFGKGSRVTIVGPARAGKTEALRRLAIALAESDDLTISVALAGVRPEEISEWSRDEALPAPAAAVSFAASEEAVGAIVEPVIDQARRLAARGTDAVVLIDSLDGVHRHAARRLLAGARNIVDGGSVTVIATASEPIGGETTVIALDASLTGIGRFPALDLLSSGTLRPELLVGEAGAEAIARTRAEVLDGEDSDEDS